MPADLQIRKEIFGMFPNGSARDHYQLPGLLFPTNGEATVFDAGVTSAKRADRVSAGRVLSIAS